MPGCPDPTSRRPPTRSSGACSQHGELAAEELTGPDGRPLVGGQLLADANCRAIRPDGSVHPRRFLLGPSVSGSAGSAGFSRPGFNGPGFRQNDAVAREILRLLQDPSHANTSRPTTNVRIRNDRRRSTMPVEFLGIAGTNSASEVTPRQGGSLDLDYTRQTGPGARGQRLGPHPVRLPLRFPGPGDRRRLYRRADRADQPGARPPAECVGADLRGQDLRHPGSHLGRPVRGALHHRRFDRRSGRRGRLPGQGHPVRPHPGVHPDRQAGVDVDRALRLRRPALPDQELPGRHHAGSAAAGRASPSAGPPPPPTRSAPRSPTSTPSGANRWPAPGSRSRPSTRRRPRRAASTGQPCRSPSGRSSRRPRNWPGRRPSPSSDGSTPTRVGRRSRGRPPGRLRRMPAPSGCSPRPPAATGTTAPCGRRPPR